MGLSLLQKLSLYFNFRLNRLTVSSINARLFGGEKTRCQSLNNGKLVALATAALVSGIGLIIGPLIFFLSSTLGFFLFYFRRQQTVEKQQETNTQ